MKAIYLKDLEELKQKAVFIDIREPWEFKEHNLGGLNIPAHELKEHYHLFKEDTLVVICSNGFRSSVVARVLSSKFPDKEIYYLEGGLY